MKLFKNLVMGLLIVTIISAFSALSFGKWGYQKARSEKTVKTLRDSAEALQLTHPGLAKSLSELADQKEARMKKMQASYESFLRTAEDSSAALERTHPDLAKGLKEYADRQREEMESVEMPVTKEDLTVTIDLLRGSAEVLGGSHPLLAKKLTAMARKKEMKMQWMEEKKEMGNELQEERLLTR